MKELRECKECGEKCKRININNEAKEYYKCGNESCFVQLFEVVPKFTMPEENNE